LLDRVLLGNWQSIERWWSGGVTANSSTCFCVKQVGKRLVLRKLCSLETFDGETDDLDQVAGYFGLK
jgi:hypothetical protein